MNNDGLIILKIIVNFYNSKFLFFFWKEIIVNFSINLWIIIIVSTLWLGPANIPDYAPVYPSTLFVGLVKWLATFVVSSYHYHHKIWGDRLIPKVLVFFCPFH